MELRRATTDQIAGLRAIRQRRTDLPIVPGFYAGLVQEAEPYTLVEPAAEPSATLPGVTPPAASAAAAQEPLGYALLLAREHDGHSHTTLIELGLGDAYQDRYEDVLDLIRDKAKPTAYLVRTDDCRLNATLLARGLQVEATALVMVPETSVRAADLADAVAAAAAMEAAVPAAGTVPGVDPAPPKQVQPQKHELARLAPAHVAGVAELLVPAAAEDEGPAHHHHGPSAKETLEEVRAMADAGEGWVLLTDGRPQAVVARLQTEQEDYELLDFVVAEGEEEGLAWAMSQATREVLGAGRSPAAIIDALDPVRRRILRQADYFTAAAYMVFYDPMAGRPSVPTITLEELRGMLKRKEKFHLVDVMGEEHWRMGHLPRSEWIDFRMLGKEARRRYKQDETIVLYCNGFT